MSVLKADTIQSTGGGAATLTKQEAAKTLMTYDHPANSILDSLNVSSGTDVSAGLLTTTFSSAFASATARQVMVSAWNTNDGGSTAVGGDPRGLNAFQQRERNTTTTVDSQTTIGANASAAGSAEDCDANYVAIFGDLA